MNLGAKFGNIRKSALAKGVMWVAGGTAIGQIVMALSTLVTTRLYSKAEFAGLGVSMALITIIGIGAGLRYDLSITLPTTEEETANCVALSLLVTLVTSVILALVIMWGGPGLFNTIGAKSLWPIWWSIPLGVLGTGIYTSLSYYSTRLKQFKELGQTRMSQSISTSVVQVGAGYLNAGSLGLTGGYVLGRFAGISRLLFAAKSDSQKLILAHANWPGIWAAAKRYKRFPLFSTPAAILNTCGLMLPVLLVNKLYGENAGGSFTLAQRVVGMPGALIIGAMSQVFLGEASRVMRENPKELLPLFDRMTKKTVKIAGVFFISGLFMPFIAGPIFGPEWKDAGTQMMILSWIAAISFVVSPVSSIANISEHQQWQLVFDATRCICIILVFIFCRFSHINANTSIVIYSLSMVATYCWAFALYRRLAIKSTESNLKIKITT